MFNSLDYVKVLEDVGLPRDQAETHIRILGRVIGEDMASKHDIQALELSARKDHHKLEDRLSGNIKNAEERLTKKIDDVEDKLTDRINSLELSMKEGHANILAQLTQLQGQLEYKIITKLGVFILALATIIPIASNYLS